MAEKYTLADARADGRRHFRLSSWLASVAMVVAYGWSITTLDDMSGGPRWLWFLLPLPFIALGLWTAFRDERRQDEVMRHARQVAGDLTAKFAIVLLFVLALAESAFGAPILIPAPFGLPPETIDTFFAAFLVLIFYVLASVLSLKHYTEGK
jgi:hypothetical protein